MTGRSLASGSSPQVHLVASDFDVHACCCWPSVDSCSNSPSSVASLVTSHTESVAAALQGLRLAVAAVPVAAASVPKQAPAMVERKVCLSAATCEAAV